MSGSGSNGWLAITINVTGEGLTALYFPLRSLCPQSIHHNFDETILIYLIRDLTSLEAGSAKVLLTTNDTGKLS